MICSRSVDLTIASQMVSACQCTQMFPKNLKIQSCFDPVFHVYGPPARARKSLQKIWPLVPCFMKTLEHQWRNRLCARCHSISGGWSCTKQSAAAGTLAIFQSRLYLCQSTEYNGGPTNDPQWADDLGDSDTPDGSRMLQRLFRQITPRQVWDTGCVCDVNTM